MEKKSEEIKELACDFAEFYTMLLSNIAKKVIERLGKEEGEKVLKAVSPVLDDVNLPDDAKVEWWGGMFLDINVKTLAQAKAVIDQLPIRNVKKKLNMNSTN